ncbi:MAG: ferrous iron transport protein A [Dehalococcoidales bacterium]|nr:MAG: ferrous iron transport protein A [Dehalococcoidales bacterium]
MLSPLSRTEQGYIGRIMKIRGKPELHRWLLKAGLKTGVVIERSMVTSPNDLVEINTNHSHIQLDQQAADNIYVKLE